MSLSTEASYYENPDLWAAERYLGQESEVRRFHAAAAQVDPAARSLLDVGTGNGAFLRVLEELRPELETIGLERALAAVDQRICRAEIRVGSGDALPFPDRSADVVSALEVIEHLPFGVYEKSLEEMERVAARQVVISVPYREARLKVRCPYCTCEFNPHYHMRRFDDDTMRSLLPTFRCERIVKVEASEVMLGSLLLGGYRWVRERAGYFPAKAVCPQCGYRAAEVQRGAPAPAASAGRVGRVMRAGQIARNLLPKRSRPKWVIGVYARP